MSRQEILEQVLNMVAMSYKKDVAGLSEKTKFDHYGRDINE